MVTRWLGRECFRLYGDRSNSKVNCVSFVFMVETDKKDLVAKC
jgi:hypothetical protein